MYKFPSAHRNGCFLHPLILTVKASRKGRGGKEEDLQRAS